MDPVVRRLDELARSLGTSRQAISMQTAVGMVCDVISDEGVVDVPDRVIALLAKHLQSKIAEAWG